MDFNWLEMGLRRREVVSIVGIACILVILILALENSLIQFGDVRQAVAYSLVAGVIGLAVFGFRHRFEPPIPTRKPVVDPPLDYQTHAISLLLGNWIDWKHSREMTLADLARLLPIVSLRDSFNPAFEPLTLDIVKEGLEHLVKAGTIKEIKDGVIRF